MGEKKQLTGDPRVDYKWFSRRHQSDAEHRAEQAERDAYRQTMALNIADRAAARAERTPKEQIAVLDQRLGVGQGAKRERARLSALVGK